jgi:hypothetical protein
VATADHKDDQRGGDRVMRDGDSRRVQSCAGQARLERLGDETAVRPGDPPVLDGQARAAGLDLERAREPLVVVQHHLRLVDVSGQVDAHTARRWTEPDERRRGNQSTAMASHAGPAIRRCSGRR